MRCQKCEVDYRLFEYYVWESGREHPQRGWISRGLFEELEEHRHRRYENDSETTEFMRAALGEEWLEHFRGRSKKAAWEELTGGGGAYPTLSTFYRHCRDSGVEDVILGYLQPDTADVVIRVLGRTDPELKRRLESRNALIAKIKDLEDAARLESNRLTRR